MLTRMMAAGLLAGVVSGLFVSGMQHVTTVPLILHAEAYEKLSVKPAAHDHSSLNSPGIDRASEPKLVLVHTDQPPEGDAAGAAQAAPAWAPADGLERTVATSVATIGTAAGFALMLLALMLASGASITPRDAALWGVAGFFITGLAPGIGLPPELPGSAAADLVSRQIWWLATAAATAAGIWLMFRTSGPARLAAGIALIAAPHLIGAPFPSEYASTAPAELAGRFTSASLAVHAVLWVLVGATSGYFWQRLSRSQAPSLATT
jgi:cobalt transporter subunit CbtA